MVTFGTAACAVAVPPSSFGAAAVAAAGVELDVVSEPQAARANTTAPMTATHPRLLIFMIGLLSATEADLQAVSEHRATNPRTCRPGAQPGVEWKASLDAGAAMRQ
jgi:hypothetical protein